ncbi:MULTISPECIES: hypothetical protein [Rheinheimera]|jgi:hypothetical protein|uniref:hypothetical protein n=1 Tax=Rheinheimera TaxID=67575 RepID=UPI001E50AD86|nr:MULTISPECIES: hypothetical protein [Rheinheimera]HJS15340.1 hypothetical protein [Rheinheimera sp.]
MNLHGFYLPWSTKVMTQPFLSKAPTVQTTQLLAALSCLFSRAKTFYQHSAETAAPGNLRRQFAALAELHQQILYLLPPRSSKTADEIEALAELSRWYNDKPNQPSLHRIQQQLAKQLQLQKAMIRNCDLGPHQMTLLHFTASVQIAADQLANRH